MKLNLAEEDLAPDKEHLGGPRLAPEIRRGWELKPRTDSGLSGHGNCVPKSRALPRATGKGPDAQGTRPRGAGTCLQIKPSCSQNSIAGKRCLHYFEFHN